VVAGFVVVPAVVVLIEDGWAAVVPAVEVRVVVVGLDAPVHRFTDPDACAQVRMWELHTYTGNKIKC
jgi:hypothetical protein